jgi:hypothetical protein
MRWWTLVLLAFLCSACTVHRAVDRAVTDLGSEAPPPELGRPGWVRGTAGIGAWVGAIGGAVLALGTLPITYPITLLADEPLGYSKQEFLFAPVTAAASAGHFVLGAPADVVDFVFRRAWVNAAPEPGYEYTPMRPPVGPGRAEETPPATETSPSERKQPPESDR